MNLKTKLDTEQYTWTSAAQSMYAMLQYTNQSSLSLTEVMGYTTHAFRIVIHQETVSPAGPTMFDPYELVSKGLKTIGINTLTYSNPAPLPDEELAAAVRFTQACIDTGVPVISWDIFAPEFGIIYGYDNEKLVFHAKDVEKDATLPYHALNERRFNSIFICGFYENIPTSMPLMLRDALTRIIEHAHGRSPYCGSPEYKHGLIGYEAWIQAFRGGKIDPFGNAYNVAVVADARRYAKQFFADLESKWKVSNETDHEVISYLKEGEHIYRQIVEPLAELSRMFPFPHGGEPNNPLIAKKAIALLEEAYTYEKQGVTLLEKLQELVSKYEDDTFMSPQLMKKVFQFAGETFTGRFENFDVEIPKNMAVFMKNEKAIIPRITNLKLVAKEPKKKKHQVTGSYIVARSVYRDPEHLPSSMQYYLLDHQYAYIRCKTKRINEAYEILESWIIDKGYQHNKNTFTIELHRALPNPNAEEEVEIYLPIKDIPLP